MRMMTPEMAANVSQTLWSTADLRRKMDPAAPTGQARSVQKKRGTNNWRSLKMFSEHPGRRIAIAGAVVLVAVLWLAPRELRQTIGLKLMYGFGAMMPAVVIGGLTGWLSYDVRAWFWTTFSLMLITVIISFTNPLLGWNIAAGAAYLCIPLAFYVFSIRKSETRKIQVAENKRESMVRINPEDEPW
ncbi:MULTISPECIES: hypothetical protein [unclassified Mesorhizobium]|uniref:hypothetical protein n=2 Tax=Mesorhizobium TaxID=68287 RepID=UPI000FCA565F|nr:MULTISPECIES: hypothetical protein [unclassified Mesorhizobium]RUZ19896.1 hypothetical protein EN949_24490 [Mesorhizobium sp. M7A.F.Ca.US.007.01.2.1]RUZ49888.1 hypothetical protein EN948_03075 [Mesorhizobium sp. M7A.F.Ca.US.003.02.1.1]RUZ70305.1 hypothetical protein EN950_00995 [Mesorhizobium sp. M7A.F.Ca.US.007.01.1.1]